MKCDALTSTLKQQRAVGRLASANELLNLRRGPRICHLTLKSKSILPQMNGLFSRSCQRSGGFRVGSEDVFQANVLLVGRHSGGVTESLVLVRATLDFSEQRVPSRVAPFHLQPCRVLGKRAALAFRRILPTTEAAALLSVGRASALLRARVSKVRRLDGQVGHMSLRAR